MTATAPSATPATGGPASAPGTQVLTPARVRLLAAADPPQLGTLVFKPGAGSDKDLMKVSTKDDVRCPAATQEFLAYVKGPTAEWLAKDIFLVPPRQHDGATPVLEDAAGSFLNLAQENSVSLVAGRYDILAWCMDADLVVNYGQFTGSIWFTDPTHYVTSDPATTTLTVAIASITTSPQDRAELGKPLSVTVQLDQATAVGTVQFTARTPSSSAPVGSPVPVVAGAATLSLVQPFGLYYLSATFTPTDSARFSSATSGEAGVAVVKPVPPTPPATVTVSGTPRVGTAVTCSAGAFGAYTPSPTPGWQWYLDLTPVEGATTNTYVPLAQDAHHLLSCRAIGTVTLVAGTDITSGRLSPAVEVSA